MTTIEMRFYELACSFFSKFIKKEEIDWEQRRYELVRDMVAAREGAPYGDGVPKSIDRIIANADMIIEELKKR